jgi:hypothetical protein
MAGWRRSEGGIGVDEWEGRIPDVLEKRKQVKDTMETKLRAGEDKLMGKMTGRPEMITCLRGGVQDDETGLTKVPSTVDELVAKQDAEYPDGLACNIGNGAQDPVTTRTGYFRGVGVREFCYSSDLNTNTAKTTHK